MTSKAFDLVSSSISNLLGNGLDLPTIDECNQFLQQSNRGVASSTGFPIRAVNQVSKNSFADNYEASIYLRGELRTRENNWHDFFNLLMWYLFPKTKAVINKWQYQKLITRTRGMPRSHAENLLTQLDEGGVVVFSSNKGLIESLTSYNWFDLFWRQRSMLENEMEFVLIGHAMYEEMLNPSVGLTSPAIIFEVDTAFMRKPQDEKVDYLDALFAAYLDNDTWHLNVQKWLSLPILGIPGWFEENVEKEFYQNKDYFWSPVNGAGA